MQLQECFKENGVADDGLQTTCNKGFERRQTVERTFLKKIMYVYMYIDRLIST